MLELTKEGKLYLKNGLPERQLENILKGDVLNLKDAKNKIESFSIALQWCKKYDCVEIKDGKIFLKNKIPDKVNKIEAALKKISEGKNVDNEILSVLLKRKLAQEAREDMKHRAKRFEGKDITNLTEDLIKTGTWKKVKLRTYNVEVPGKRYYSGKRHPYSKFLWSLRRKLIQMGFKEIVGTTVELEFWNFDALFQPQNHPSRDWTQTYSIKNPKTGKLPDKKIVDGVANYHEKGWQYIWDKKKASRLMPIAHDTAISPKTLVSKDLEIPGKYFQIVRCYRPDVIDATHGVEFNQMGGFVIAEDLDFQDLLGLLKMFAVDVGGCDPDSVRFFPDYYPFTEPSVQISAKHPEMGWVELAGAGIFREEMTRPLGIKYPVIAWGFGVDRLAMYKLGLGDVRELFSSNLNWLRNYVVV